MAESSKGKGKAQESERDKADREAREAAAQADENDPGALPHDAPAEPDPLPGEQSDK